MHGIPPGPPPRPHRRSTPYAWERSSEGSQSSMGDDPYQQGFASEHIEIHPQVFVETTCHAPCREEVKNDIWLAKFFDLKMEID